MSDLGSTDGPGRAAGPEYVFLGEAGRPFEFTQLTKSE